MTAVERRGARRSWRATRSSFALAGAAAARALPRRRGGGLRLVPARRRRHRPARRPACGRARLAAPARRARRPLRAARRRPIRCSPPSRGSFAAARDPARATPTSCSTGFAHGRRPASATGRWHELLLYCYRVAGTVGLMMCHADGRARSGALPHAAHLGIAMQLTNICRDVAEDWQRGRLYLPRGAARRTPTRGGARSRVAARGDAVASCCAADGLYRSGDAGLRRAAAPLRRRHPHRPPGVQRASAGVIARRRLRRAAPGGRWCRGAQAGWLRRCCARWTERWRARGRPPVRSGAGRDQRCVRHLRRPHPPVPARRLAGVRRLGRDDAGPVPDHAAASCWPGRAAGVRFPVEAWLVPLGAVVFTVAIAIDTIGHRTIYKQALRGRRGAGPPDHHLRRRRQLRAPVRRLSRPAGFALPGAGADRSCRSSTAWWTRPCTGAATSRSSPTWWRCGATCSSWWATGR